jgi:long-chain acyl-CoA synthetase
MKFPEIIKPGAYPDTPPQVDLSPDDTVYLMYTGGTTGLPKGAVLTHRNSVAENLVAIKYMNWDQVRGPVISAFPMFHIAGLTFNAISILCGWTQLLMPDPRNTDFCCQMLENTSPGSSATCRPCTTCSWPIQIQADRPFQRPTMHFRGRAVSGGFPEGLRKHRGPGQADRAVRHDENHGHQCDESHKGSKKARHRGSAHDDTDLKLVDPTTGQEVGVGEPGEIWVRNAMVMKEYYKKPEETKATVDEEGYMHTGDVAIMDSDGYLTLVDRTKDMIIVSGYKVFSKKVEDIMADHPAVEIMATVGVQNPDRPGSELVKAYVVLAQDYNFDGDEDKLKRDILDFAKEHLAPYEVPKQIEIIKEMPLTSVGKLDKKALRAEARGQ